MIKKHNLTFIAIMLAAFLNAQVKPEGNSKPLNNGAKPKLNYEYALNDPLNARIYTLKNGMKVYLSVYKNAPRIQTYIAVKAGSKNDPAECTGLAHYLEHMVFKGTDKFGTKNWVKESSEIKKIENLYEVYRKTKDNTERKNIYHQIDSISGVAAKYAIANEYDKMLASIGADGTNAFTSFDQTVYVNDIPSNQIDNWLKIESERFRKLVLRLFHTELEAVYEEKNRNLDSDNNKVFEAVMEGLFKKHTYGTQTTIGTIDHLKNPSMVEINKYFNKYYVPNNMAIIMSGDFDPDKVIVQIEKHFGSFQTKPVEAFKFEPEQPITKKEVKEVWGPDPESINITWRLNGTGSKDEELGTLLAAVLFNNTAGLLDLNLNQAQKVLRSDAALWSLKDYSLFNISGQPKDGQTLEQVRQLLHEQLALVKNGDFPQWLLHAVITDMKLQSTRSLEQNTSRAGEMLSAFVNDEKWQAHVNRLQRISSLTRQDLIDFVNKNFNENSCVEVYKRIGEDKSVQKVEKPVITPVEVDRDNASVFVQNIMKSAPKSIDPKFIDYEKDVVKSEIKTVPVLYNKNTENNVFELYYNFDLGKNSDKVLPVVTKYIPFISTNELSAPKIKEEFYKLGCSYSVFCDNDNTWISLSGLNDNFEKAVELFEKILTEAKVEETVLKNLKADIIKERNDNKLEKHFILNSGMVNYALYGAENPFSYVLSDEELGKVTVNDIKERISKLQGYQHKILYYGPMELDAVKSVIGNYHKVQTSLPAPPAAKQFNINKLENTVYVVDYDMKQAEIIMLSNGGDYDPAKVPLISLYNTYFGGGMSSIVFQDLRESKALAYSTYSRFVFPRKRERKSYNNSYIGSQADKLAEAIKGLKDLLDNLPKADQSFEAGKEMVLQDLRTQRINKADILFDYLSAKDLGLQNDIRKDIFEKVSTYTFADVKKFHEQNIQNKPTTMLVLGKKDALDLKVLEKYGNVKFLTLKDVFGY